MESDTLYGSQPQPAEEEGFFQSLALAPVRGVAGAAAGVANLFGADVQDNFGLGHSTGMVGGLVEGATQFLTGFIPGVGVLGRVGALSKGVQATTLATRGAMAARGVQAARATVAGSIADFAVFDGNDQRISNLIQSIPELQNPITEFLAAKDEDGEVLGRMKNVIEGAGIGFLSDAIVGMFRGMRKHNRLVEEGKVEEAAEVAKDIEGLAEEALGGPTSDLEADIKAEVDDGVKVRRPEEEGALPVPVGEPTNPLSPVPVEPDEMVDELVTPEKVAAKMKNPRGGMLIVVNTSDTGEVIKGLSQFDGFVREPGSRLSVLQLEPDAKVLRANSREANQLVGGKRRADESPEVYQKRLFAAAKAAGYDAVSYRTNGGRTTETHVLRREAIEREVRAESNKPFFREEAVANILKEGRPDLTGASRIERALIHANLSPETVGNILDRFKAVKDALEAYSPETKAADGALVNPKAPVGDAAVRDLLGKLEGVLNFEKMGSRDAAALSYAITQELDWTALKDPRVSLERAAQSAGDNAAKYVAMDPAEFAKVLELDADNIAEASKRKLAAQWMLDLWGKKITGLAQDLANGRQITDLTGKPLNPEEAAVMLSSAIKNYQLVGTQVARIRSAKGRALGQERLGVDRLSNVAKLAQLEAQGGVDWAMKTARRIVEDAKYGGIAHAMGMLAKAGRRERFWAAITDWYMFSLLSAPKTLTTNLIGGLMTSQFAPLEKWWGSITARMTTQDSNMLKALKRTQQRSLMQANILGQQVVAMFGLSKDMLKDGPGLPKSQEQALKSTVSSFERSFKGGRSLLGNAAGQFDQPARLQGIGAENIGALMGKDIPKDSPLGKSLEWLGKVTRLPGEYIQATDDFLKHLSAQTYMMSELAAQGMEAGLKGDMLDEFVSSEMRNMVRNGELMNRRALREEAEQIYTRERFADMEVRDRFIEDWMSKQMADGNVRGRSTILEEAERIAREVTFTTPLDPRRGPMAAFGQMMQRLANDYPAMRFFTPFIRTPLNILMYAADRMPVPVMNPDFMPFVGWLAQKSGLPIKLDSSKSRFMRQITSGNPEEVAEAMGRATTAVGIGAAMGTFAASGVITGRGPEDPEHRSLLQATGWQPYSIKVGDTYVSYQKLDPFASMIGFFADWADITRYSQDNDGLEDLALGWVMATVTNLESKSYLAGVTDLVNLLSDPVQNFEKTAGRIVGSMVVPNAIAATRSFTDEQMPDLNGILDRVRARVPFLSSGMDKQRNVLGEPLDRRTFGGILRFTEGVAGYMAPLQINATTSDIVTKELADLAYPFSMPRPEKWGIDLRDYRNDKGQSAYDRWMELTGEVSVDGRKLRPAMERLIKSHAYQRLEVTPIANLDLDSPRVATLNSLVGKYRRAAERQLLVEFPDLQQQTLDRRVAREALKQGVSAEEVRAKLFPQGR